MIDTLALSERLAQKGFNEQQAKALAEELFQGNSDSDLATKSDVTNGLSKLKDTLVGWLLAIIGMIFGSYLLIIGLIYFLLTHPKT